MFVAAASFLFQKRVVMLNMGTRPSINPTHQRTIQDTTFAYENSIEDFAIIVVYLYCMNLLNFFCNFTNNAYILFHIITEQILITNL